MTLHQKVADALHLAMISAGIDAATLARESGVGVVALTECLEARDTFDFDVWSNLALVLGVDPNQLLAGNIVKLAKAGA
jgi:cytidylate kinase